MFSDSVEATVRQCRVLPGAAGPDGRPGQPVALSAITVRRYCRKIEARWALEDVEKRPNEKRRLSRMVRAQIRKALAAGAHGAAMRGIEMLARLHGLFAPDVLEVCEQEQGSRFAGWSLEDIETYQALKARLRGGAPGPVLAPAAGSNGKSSGRPS
jgi:hypothetical protein